ncbi:hypothetical protein HMPREF3232_01221, partial [Fannyhessea vaginae]
MFAQVNSRFFVNNSKNRIFHLDKKCVKITAYKHVKPFKLEKKFLILGGGLCVLIFVFVCSSKMVKNGKTKAGKQRYRCLECGSSPSRRYALQARDLKLF